MTVAEKDSTIEGIDLTQYSLALADEVKITMPPFPEVTEEDIDAQMFSYISNAPKGSKLTTLQDLHDEWAQANFPDIQTVAELREIIKARLEQENKVGYQNMTYARCADAVVDSLEGDIPEEVIAKHFEEVKLKSEKTIHSYGESITQYLRSEGLTEEEYHEKLLEETRYELAMNIALDLMIRDNGIDIPEEELTQYLSAEDSDAFLDMLHRENKVEEAKLAAARVKIMRDIIDSAAITIA